MKTCNICFLLTSFCVYTRSKDIEQQKMCKILVCYEDERKQILQNAFRVGI